MRRIFLGLFLCIWTVGAFSSCISPEKEVIIVAYSSLNFEAASSQVPFEISTNFLWNIEITDSWLNVSPVKGYGDKQLTVKVSANPSIKPRDASFFIVGEQKRQEITVHQEGEAPVLIFPETTGTVPAAGGEHVIKATTNLDIKIDIQDPWVSYVATRTVADREFVFSVSPNTELTARATQIVFKPANGDAAVSYTLSQYGETEDIVLQETEVSIAAEGASRSVEVTANIPWEAVASDSWIHIVGTKTMESTACMFTVDANPRVEAREGNIIVKKVGSTQLSRTILVKQDGAAERITLVPEAFDDIPYRPAAEYVLKVDANFDWTINAASLESWVSAPEVNRADSTVTFSVAENTDVHERTTSFSIVRRDKNYYKSVSITQAASPERLSIGVGVQDFKHIPAAGRELTAEIISNVAWEAVSDKDWVRLAPRTKALESKILDIVVEGHTATEPRTARITVTTAEASAFIDLTQLGAEPLIVLDPESLNVPGSVHTAKLTVTSNVKWEIVDLPSWIAAEALPPTKAYADSSVLLLFKENITDVVREARPAIKQVDGSCKVLLPVRQAPPAFSVVPARLSIPAVGAVGQKVMVGADVPWDIVSGPDWVGLSSSQAGPSRYDSLLIFDVAANTGTSPRTGEVVIRHRGGAGKISVSFVQQAGVITSSPESFTVDAPGGQLQASIGATVPWHIDKLPSWIKLDGCQPLEAPGDSLLTLTVVSNNTAEDRTDKIILQQTGGAVTCEIPVTQKKPYIVLSPSELTLSGAAHSRKIQITSNVEWEVMTRDVPWVSIASISEDRTELVLNVEANATAGSRAANIRFSHKGGAYCSVLTVTQEAATLQISPSTLALSASAGTAVVKIFADIDWKVHEKPDWVTVEQENIKRENTVYTVPLSIAANTDTDLRKGLFVVALENGLLRDTLEISQAGGSPYLNVSVSKSLLHNEGDTLSLTIESNIPVSYSTDAEWLSQTGVNTSGRSTCYTMKASPTTLRERRQARIFVSTATGENKDTLTLVQKEPRIARADSLVLVDFFNVLKGEGWRDNMVWDLAMPATTWFGVQLRTVIQSGAYRVQKLSLPNARLRGYLPEKIGELSYLEELDLSQNISLTGILYRSWADDLVYLRVLNLSDCALSNDKIMVNIPKEWGPIVPKPGTTYEMPFADLETFIISNNYFTGEIPEEITWHTNYSKWDFAKNIAPQRSGSLTEPKEKEPEGQPASGESGIP